MQIKANTALNLGDASGGLAQPLREQQMAPLAAPTGLAASLLALAARLLALAVFLLSAGFSSTAWAAGIDRSALLSEDEKTLETAVFGLAAQADDEALAVLSALLADTLRIDASGHAFVKTEDGYKPLEAASGPVAGSLREPMVNNSMRRLLEPQVAGLKLKSKDVSIRRRAALELSKRPDPELRDTIAAAFATEKDKATHSALGLCIATIDLGSTDKARRLSAVKILESEGDASVRPELMRITAKDDAGAFREPDAELRAAASRAIGKIESRSLFHTMLSNLLYGISLGSVLLLAALGLAITFGLMRVINMAHGELLMIGAYATYAVQQFVDRVLPSLSNGYLILAVPVAFLVSGAVGWLIEVLVLRFLYGRPLETLLATWGVSLILIQTVRLIFGAQNVTVSNPSWLSGGIELMPEVVVTYSRLAIVVFSGAVCAFVWWLLQKTQLGLHVRAVTQNRNMAAAIGIRTRRVDSLAFAVGSGVAGLGGVALSQIGNVGPELGQSYIVDSFMVVVLGGVGKLLGTLLGAFGLGIVNKVLEPISGAVLGKIAVLVFIVLFIQARPSGLFALKGRAAEAM